jgi:hypothetical protein
MMTAAPPLRFVTFETAGHLCAIEACLIRHTRYGAASEESGVRWGEQIFGLPTTSDSRRQIAQLRHTEVVRLSLPAPLTLIDIPGEAIYPLPCLIAAHQQLNHLIALALFQQRLMLIFDPRPALLAPQP